jgi:hypothetical protein
MFDKSLGTTNRKPAFFFFLSRLFLPFETSNVLQAQVDLKILLQETTFAADFGE